MRSIGVVAGIFALLLVAVSDAAERALPRHPTLLYAEYDGERHLVIAADGKKPVIAPKGKRVTLPSDTELFTERASTYGSYSARLEEMKPGVPTVISRGFFMPGAPREYSGLEWVHTFDLVSDQDIPDCYTAVITFNKEFLMGEDEREEYRRSLFELRPRPVMPAQIRVQQIGDLRAGVSRSVSLTVNYLTAPIYVNSLAGAMKEEDPIHFLLPLFSGGHEIRTANIGDMPGFFRKREQVAHSKLKNLWLEQNRGTSRPLRPMLQIPPLFDSTEGLPAEIVAILTIEPDGTVSEVVLDRELPEGAAQILTNTLYAWLFLPKLENGTPVASKVGVPLKF